MTELHHRHGKADQQTPEADRSIDTNGTKAKLSPEHRRTHGANENEVAHSSNGHEAQRPKHAKHPDSAADSHSRNKHEQSQDGGRSGLSKLQHAVYTTVRENAFKAVAIGTAWVTLGNPGSLPMIDNSNVQPKGVPRERGAEVVRADKNAARQPSAENQMAFRVAGPEVAKSAQHVSDTYKASAPAPYLPDYPHVEVERPEAEQDPHKKGRENHG